MILSSAMDTLLSNSLESKNHMRSADLPRVLHVGKFYPPHMGGIETHLRDLCVNLCKSIQLKVVVASDDRSALRETRDGVPISRVPTWATLASTPICPGMIRQIREFDGEIVHLHFPNPMSVLAYLLSGHRGTLVVTYHSDMVRQVFLGAMFEPLLHWALRRSSAIIVTSANYIESSPVLTAYRDKCHVIPLGIPIDEFQHPDPAAVLELQQKYCGRLVVSVGRLVYYKGFEYLIRAMAKVRGHLLIVGQGPLHAELESLITGLGLSDRVRLLGKLSHQQLVNCYHSAQVFALASVARSEAFGIAQVEAMASGLPVVNTSLESGVPYVSQHERTGLTVPPADPDAFAAAINVLLDDGELRASYARAAKLRAQEQFSAEAMASRTLALYRQLGGFAAQDRIAKSANRTLPGSA